MPGASMLSPPLSVPIQRLPASSPDSDNITLLLRLLGLCVALRKCRNFPCGLCKRSTPPPWVPSHKLWRPSSKILQTALLDREELSLSLCTKRVNELCSLSKR